MSDTPNLTLPLLAAAQAQKHVTVNEALARLDALAMPSALNVAAAPPTMAADGDTHIVAAGATGDWMDRDDELAFRINGGWSFASPRPGWRVWIASEATWRTWTGDRWVADLAGAFHAGAHSRIVTISGDAALNGASIATLTIPDRAVVFGVTARVLTAITGAGVTGWRLGVAGAEDRYGSAIGLAKDSVVNGITGAPVGYFADTPLSIAAEGGVFDGGLVRFAIHYLALTPPDAL